MTAFLRGAFHGRRVTVIGASRSGLAAARLLLREGAHVTITDASMSPSVRGGVEQLEHLAIVGQLRTELGRHTPDSVIGSALVITSPGVRADAPPIYWAQRQGIPIMSEVELASWFCPAPIIAVTGTNGKSTTTMMITRLLQAAGMPAIACGNIGYPLSDALTQLTPAHHAVIEVSSFQLERCRTFRPHIAVLLNLAPNHLDYHRTFDAYCEAKYRLLHQQTGADWAILNMDDPNVVRAARHTQARIRWFQQGERNLLWQAASRVAHLLDISTDVVHDTMRRFRGLPHRQELVWISEDEVRFVNDSKSTTPASLQWALETVGGPHVLIAGGKNKGLDFRPVVSTIARLNHRAGERQPHVRAAVVMGDNRAELRQLLSPLVPVREATSLAEAVTLARQHAHPHDTVLLSPGCASFDMFCDFEDRGAQFAHLVTTAPPSAVFAAAPRALTPSVA